MSSEKTETKTQNSEPFVPFYPSNVAVYKYKKLPPSREFGPTEDLVDVRVLDYHATFLDWGVDCKEFNNGVGNFTVGIVRRIDGSVEAVLPELMQVF